MDLHFRVADDGMDVNHFGAFGTEKANRALKRTLSVGALDVFH